MPTFDKYTQTDPILDPDTVPAILPYLSQLAVDYKSDEVAKSYMTSASNACRVDITLTAEEITAITLSARQETKFQISSMDALAGYFATIVNRIAEEPIDQLVHVVEASGYSVLMAFWWLIFIFYKVSRSETSCKQWICPSFIYICRQCNRHGDDKKICR